MHGQTLILTIVRIPLREIDQKIQYTLLSAMVSILAVRRTAPESCVFSRIGKSSVKPV
jgi:hypothetical protein